MEEVRDPMGVARHVIIWSYIWMGGKVLTGLAGLAMLVVGPIEVAPETTIADLGLLISFIPFLVSITLACVWLYRMTAAKRSLGEDTVISPGWAIGWFFVPIANLFRPFEAIKEAWQVCENPEAWWHMPIPDMLRWWWGLWLAFNVLENVVSRISKGSFEAMCIGLAAAGLLAIPLTILWARIVRHISAAESRLLSAAVFR